MPAPVRRPKAPIEAAHAATFDALIQGHADYLSGARAVLGDSLTLPASEMGAAGALINATLAQIERRVAHQRLIALYAAMFGPGADGADAEGLATDRALASQASAAHEDASLYTENTAENA